MEDRSYMVQYGIWPNCCNACDFCLRLNRETLDKAGMIEMVRNVRENMKYIDWKGKFSAGISILGGELYFVRDWDVQEEVMRLIDDIIDKVLLVSPNPDVKFSTVTNGLYDPGFLFRVVDRIRDRAGMKCVDVNFSYDLKYRFRSKEDEELCLENINRFIKRYDYRLGVQMILTQYVIDMVREGKWDVGEFMEKKIPGGQVCFLYPHPVHTGKVLKDFNFRRKDLIWFLGKLKNENPEIFESFLRSTDNSGTFKYTGYRYKTKDATQEPVLSDGKEEINPKCGHSVLYQCYSDSDRCLNCDVLRMGGER